MNLRDADILDVLFKGHYITQELFDEAKGHGKKEGKGLSFLLEEGLVTKDLIGQAIAETYSAPYADLNTHVPGKETVRLIPEAMAKKYRAVVFQKTEKGVTVATDNPTAAGLKQAVDAQFKVPVTYAYSLPEDIDAVLRFFNKAFSDQIDDLFAKGGKAPQIVEALFQHAVTVRASDIHFEPQDKHTRIRLRVDGILREVGQLENEFYQTVVNRVKVLSKLRTDKHAQAQDGAVRYKIGDQQVDMRVSIIPTFDGEKMVLRLLASYTKGFSLGDLGMDEADRKTLKALSKKPFGMIIVSGPTGSGKTTTLYATLKYLNNPEINITTIEDPVEYKIDGVNHIQVNRDADLTFSRGLRSIVRQDPDIILVGEIRDEETAEIAVNAALTGHLLLSTFHANDAVTTIPRLLDMGIEPFLLTSTLEAVMGQRLVRKVCETCKYSVTPTDVERLFTEAFYGDKEGRLYRGKGCEACGHSGYTGRSAIFEIIPISPEMEDAMMNRASSQDLWKIAASQGVRSMFDDGMQKVERGITTLEEVLRVIEPPKAFILSLKEKGISLDDVKASQVPADELRPKQQPPQTKESHEADQEQAKKDV